MVRAKRLTALSAEYCATLFCVVLLLMTMVGRKHTAGATTAGTSSSYDLIDVVEDDFAGTVITRNVGGSFIISCTVNATEVEHPSYWMLFKTVPKDTTNSFMLTTKMIMNDCAPPTPYCGRLNFTYDVVPNRWNHLKYTWKISNLRPSDSGRYWCRANRKGDASLAYPGEPYQPEMRLSVVQKPQTLLINGTHQLVTRPLFVGEHALFICSAFNGWPQVELNWTIDQNVLKMNRAIKLGSTKCYGDRCNTKGSYRCTEDEHYCAEDLIRYNRSDMNNIVRWDDSWLDFTVRESDRNRVIQCTGNSIPFLGDNNKSQRPMSATAVIGNVYSKPNSTKLTAGVINVMPNGGGARTLLNLQKWPQSDGDDDHHQSRLFVNETVKFECAVRGGLPLPVISWQLVDYSLAVGDNNSSMPGDAVDNKNEAILLRDYHDGDLSHNTDNITFLKFDRKSVSDTNLSVTTLSMVVGPQHHGKVMRCVANNEATRYFREAVYDNFTFEVFHVPSSVSIDGPAGVVAGDEVSFNCTSRDSYPKPQFSWTLDGNNNFLRSAEPTVKISTTWSKGFDAVSTITFALPKHEHAIASLFFSSSSTSQTSVSRPERLNNNVLSCAVYTEGIATQVTAQKSFVLYKLPQPPVIQRSIEGSANSSSSTSDVAKFPVPVGRWVKYECISRGGHPAPRIEWYDLSRDGIKLLTTAQYISGDSEQRSVVTFDNVTADLHQTKLECRVTAALPASSTSKPDSMQKIAVELEVAFPPAQVDIKLPNKQQEVWPLNSDVLLTCVSSPSFPQANLTWYVNEKPVQASSPTSQTFDVATRTTMVQSTYLVHTSRDRHQSQIKCEARNGYEQRVAAGGAGPQKYGMASETLLLNLDPQPADRITPGLSLPVAAVRETGSHAPAPQMRLIRFNKVSLRAVRKDDGSFAGSSVNRISLDNNLTAKIVIIVIVTAIVIIGVCVVCMCVARRVRRVRRDSTSSSSSSKSKKRTNSKNNKRKMSAKVQQQQQLQQLGSVYDINHNNKQLNRNSVSDSSNNDSDRTTTSNYCAHTPAQAGGGGGVDTHAYSAGGGGPPSSINSSSLSRRGGGRGQEIVIAPIDKDHQNPRASRRLAGAAAGKMSPSSTKQQQQTHDEHALTYAVLAGRDVVDSRQLQNNNKKCATPAVRRPMSSVDSQCGSSMQSSNQSSFPSDETKVTINAAVDEMQPQQQQQSTATMLPYEHFLDQDAARSNYATLVRNGVVVVTAQQPRETRVMFSDDYPENGLPKVPSDMHLSNSKPRRVVAAASDQQQVSYGYNPPIQYQHHQSEELDVDTQMPLSVPYAASGSSNYHPHHPQGALRSLIDNGGGYYSQQPQPQQTGALRSIIANGGYYGDKPHHQPAAPQQLQLYNSTAQNFASSSPSYGRHSTNNNYVEQQLPYTAQTMGGGAYQRAPPLIVTQQPNTSYAYHHTLDNAGNGTVPAYSVYTVNIEPRNHSGGGGALQGQQQEDDDDENDDNASRLSPLPNGQQQQQYPYYYAAENQMQQLHSSNYPKYKTQNSSSAFNAEPVFVVPSNNEEQQQQMNFQYDDDDEEGSEINNINAIDQNCVRSSDANTVAPAGAAQQQQIHNFINYTASAQEQQMQQQRQQQQKQQQQQSYTTNAALNYQTERPWAINGGGGQQQTSFNERTARSSLQQQQQQQNDSRNLSTMNGNYAIEKAANSVVNGASSFANSGTLLDVAVVADEQQQKLHHHQHSTTSMTRASVHTNNLANGGSETGSSSSAAANPQGNSSISAQLPFAQFGMQKFLQQRNGGGPALKQHATYVYASDNGGNEIRGDLV